MFDDKTKEDTRKRMEAMNLKGQGGRDHDTETVTTTTTMEVDERSPLGRGVMEAVNVDDTPLGMTGDILRQAQVRQMEEEAHRR